MLRQYAFILKSRILDCFDFLQKSRNDGVGEIVIAICCAYYAVIARFGNAESWQSIPYRHSERSEESILAIRESRSIRLHCTNLSIIHLIRSYIIYFTHCFKSSALDTSLRINATLSMTKMFGLPRKFYEFSRNDGVGRFVIARICVSKFVAIHFTESRITRDSLTLGESMCLGFTQFTHFGLLRLAKGKSRNDESMRHTASLRGVANAEAIHYFYDDDSAQIHALCARFAHKSKGKSKAIQCESTHESRAIHSPR